MVIHTVINEYDLLYAQEREAAYASAEISDNAHTDTAAYTVSTRLPDIRKGNFANDNS